VIKQDTFLARELEYLANNLKSFEIVQTMLRLRISKEFSVLTYCKPFSLMIARVSLFFKADDIHI